MTVHYVLQGEPDGTYAPDCYEAVTASPDATVNPGSLLSLLVQGPSGELQRHAAPYSEGRSPFPDETGQAKCTGLVHQGGTWHFPAQRF